MKKLILGFIAFSSMSVFSETQKIVCKEKSRGMDYDVTLILDFTGNKINRGQIKYSGTSLIEGLYKGQTTGDSTDGGYSGGRMTIKLEGENYIIRGNGWNPSVDDPNFYAVLLPKNFLGKEFNREDQVVYLNAMDTRDNEGDHVFMNIFVVKCVSTIN